MEEQIKQAALLYKMRDTCKKLYAKEYPAKIKEYKGYIHACMTAHGIKTELEAAIYLCDSCKLEGVQVMNMFAACVELIEPSI